MTIAPDELSEEQTYTVDLIIGETGALGATIGDLSPEATYTIDFGFHATTQQ